MLTECQIWARNEGYIEKNTEKMYIGKKFSQGE